jgi:hypothetical protein
MIEEVNMICFKCGDELSEEEIVNPREIDNEIICDNCYDDSLSVCEICASSFEESENPKDTYFYINNETSTNDMPMGLYEGVEFPIYSSDYFSVHLITGNSRCIKKIDLEKILDKEIGSEFICQECFEKYSKECEKMEGR